MIRSFLGLGLWLALVLLAQAVALGGLRRGRGGVAPVGCGIAPVSTWPMTSSAADGKHSIQSSLIRNMLLVPRCSTRGNHVSANRRRCSETVDWLTSMRATISPTVISRFSLASRLKIWRRVGLPKQRNQLANISARSRSTIIVYRRYTGTPRECEARLKDHLPA